MQQTKQCVPDTPHQHFLSYPGRSQGVLRPDGTGTPLPCDFLVYRRVFSQLLLPGNVHRWPNQMPQAPLLDPFDVNDVKLHSELFPRCQSSSRCLKSRAQSASRGISFPLCSLLLFVCVFGRILSELRTEKLNSSQLNPERIKFTNTQIIKKKPYRPQACIIKPTYGAEEEIGRQ